MMVCQRACVIIATGHTPWAHGLEADEQETFLNQYGNYQ